MIGVPYNDPGCLGAITDLAADLVEQGDELIAELAAQHETTDSLQGWMRGLPQRDDLGDPDDGPKVDECNPPQRLRFGAEDPNCVERAALYVAVAELIDPAPYRQLATLDVTPVGLHTFPLEDGEAVILDPRVDRDCLDCALALAAEGPVPIAPHQAIEWTTRFAGAGAVPLRNGPDLVRAGRAAIDRLVNHGTAPANEREVDLIAWLLSVAEAVARKYGPRALLLVRSTALAIAELVDEAIARAALPAQPPPPPPIRNLPGVAIWGSALVGIATKVGDHVGKVLVKKLGSSKSSAAPRAATAELTTTTA